ncbi:MAG: hypothetical protein KF754_01585 [Planctomycetes bacterium]|nr:hypothetical protein [Planctomycetota bacterium]
MAGQGDSYRSYYEQFSAVFSNFIRKAGSNLKVLTHSGLKGQHNEELLATLLTDVLPGRYTVHTNSQLVGTDGARSAECDVVVVDETFLPRLFLDPKLKLFPTDAAMGVVEVKSSMDATELVDAFAKAERIKKLKFIRTAFDAGGGRKGFTVPSAVAIVAWTTKTSNLETAMRWLTNCIVGREYSELPDLVYFADLAILYGRTSMIAMGPAAADQHQAGVFIARSEDDQEALVEAPWSKQPVAISQTRAFLNFVMTFESLVRSVARCKRFSAERYLPEEFREMAMLDLPIKNGKVERDTRYEQNKQDQGRPE